MKKKKSKDDKYLKRVADTPAPIKRTAHAVWHRALIEMETQKIYELGCLEPVSMIPRQGKAELGFWCPLCYAKFEVEVHRFNLENTLTCFCGTKLVFDEGF